MPPAKRGRPTSKVENEDPERARIREQARNRRRALEPRRRAE